MIGILRRPLLLLCIAALWAGCGAEKRSDTGGEGARGEQVQALQDSLDTMETRLAAVGEKLDRAQGESKEALQELYREIEDRLESLESRLDDLKQAGGEAWESGREALAGGIESLREELEELERKIE